VLTLGAMVVIYLWRSDRDTRSAARSIAIATAVAIAIAVALYYRHFGDAYRTLAHIRAEAVASAPPTSAVGASAASPSLSSRVGDAATITARAIGWPLLILAALGGWRLFADSARDRLTRTIVASAACFVVLFVVGITSPVDPSYRRYLVEFVARAALAALPAIAIVAARGGSWLWRSHLAGRAALALLGCATFWLAAREWLGWIGA
jgi:hypothetical protein